MNVILGTLTVFALVLIGVAGMYPGIKDTVRSEMRDKYESRIEQLTKENKQLRWQVAHPIFKITTLGGGYDDDGTEDTE